MAELPDLRRPSWVDRVPAIRFLEVFEKYRHRIFDRETGLPFAPSQHTSAPFTIEGLAFQTGAGFRLALKIFFPVCAAVFCLSFLWDFYGLVRSCSVAGMIGFGTNWVAIKMLFWPRVSRPVFGHGLIPAQRDQLIDKVASEVLNNLINEELIFQKIAETRIVERFSTALIDKLHALVNDPTFREDVRHMVLTYVGQIAADPAFRQQVKERAERSVEDVAGTRFRSWLVTRLGDVWRAPLVELLNQEIERLDVTLGEGIERMGDLLENLPKALEERNQQIDRALTTMLISLVREIDVRVIVYEQLATVTPEQLEIGFREFADDKLAYITLLGGLFGVIGGTVIVFPIAAPMVLVGLGVSLLGLDLTVGWLMRTRAWPRR